MDRPASTYILADDSMVPLEDLLELPDVRAVAALADVSPGIFVAGTGAANWVPAASGVLINPIELIEPIPDYPPSWPESLKWAPIRPNAYKAIATVPGKPGSVCVVSAVEQAALVVTPEGVEQTIMLLSDDRREVVFAAAIALGIDGADLHFVTRFIEQDARQLAGV